MSSTDDPQTTPEVTPTTRGALLAQIITATHLMREDLARLEESIRKTSGQIDGLVSTTKLLADQIGSLTIEVQRLTTSDDELRDGLGGVREGLRRTNQRLRAVDGGD